MTVLTQLLSPVINAKAITVTELRQQQQCYLSIIQNDLFMAELMQIAQEVDSAIPVFILAALALSKYPTDKYR